MFDCGLPLHSAHIRAPHHTDTPATPSLTCDPFDGVKSILALIIVRSQDALRLSRTTAVLNHYDIASLGIPFRIPFLSRLVIRCPHEDHGPLGYRGITIDVGRESNAIAHGYRDGFDLDIGHCGACDCRSNEDNNEILHN